MHTLEHTLESKPPEAQSKLTTVPIPASLASAHLEAQGRALDHTSQRKRGAETLPTLIPSVEIQSKQSAVLVHLLTGPQWNQTAEN